MQGQAASINRPNTVTTALIQARFAEAIEKLVT